MFQFTLFGESVPVTRATTTCARCGRQLTNPVSVQRGYGPVCWGKINHAKGDTMYEFEDIQLNVPLEEGIILRRSGPRMEAESRISTNVPHLVAHHSPTGFEWGYGGSGPSDLALNIVEALLRRMDYNGETTTDVWDKSRIFRKSWELHHDFKRDFIAAVPEEGEIIPYNRVITWINMQLAMEEAIEV
jgi:hypothetical protein